MGPHSYRIVSQGWCVDRPQRPDENPTSSLYALVFRDGEQLCDVLTAELRVNPPNSESGGGFNTLTLTVLAGDVSFDVVDGETWAALTEGDCE